MKILNTTQTILALIPLVLIIGYLGQRHDEHYLLGGFLFAWLVMLYLVYALRWYQYRVVTLVWVWLVALVAMVLMIEGGGTAAAITALPVWAMLHFGPKQPTAEGERLEQEETVQHKKWSAAVMREATFWWVGTGVLGLMVLAAAENGLRQLDLQARYQHKDCATVTVLKQAVLCYDSQQRLRLVDSFFDNKGRQLHYRLSPIQGEQALQSVVGYASGRHSHRYEVRFAIEGDTIHIVRHGYGILYDQQGQADIASGVMRYEEGVWLGTETATQDRLRRLQIETPAEQAGM